MQGWPGNLSHFHSWLASCGCTINKLSVFIYTYVCGHDMQCNTHAITACSRPSTIQQLYPYLKMRAGYIMAGLLEKSLQALFTLSAWQVVLNSTYYIWQNFLTRKHPWFYKWSLNYEYFPMNYGLVNQQYKSTSMLPHMKFSCEEPFSNLNMTVFPLKKFCHIW